MCKTEKNATLSGPSTSKTEMDLNIDRVAAQLLSLSASYNGQEKGEMEKKKNVISTSNYRFKTMICNSFKEKGRCPYGDKCQFAHGNDVRKFVCRKLCIIIPSFFFFRKCVMY